jgi:DNA-binding NtrC family response regulator
MKGKQRILIVDDEHDITFVPEMMLNDRCEVDAYTDPVEALANVKPDRDDLILFGYLMPKVNGFEFYDKIEQVDPVVNTCRMTAYEAIPVDGSGNEPVMSSDSKFALRKPFDLTQMLAKFEEIMKDRKT